MKFKKLNLTGVASLMCSMILEHCRTSVKIKLFHREFISVALSLVIYP